ncbi:hypothetical protein DFH29DRAFT_882190 [Suillus ampliporus]|nr:hypothetical protein DFH29DRAFT_882190 [Suillus ampliporus]
MLWIHVDSISVRSLVPSNKFTLSKHYLLIVAPAVIPPKVDEAVRQYKYIPYISITPAAHLYAFRSSKETFSFNSQGILTAKGLDCSRERSIRFHEWLTASRIVEERVAFHHGASRGAAFASHHRVISDLASSHGWDIAQEYNISQRELAAQNPAHDLTGLDMSALTLVATQAAARKTLAPLATSAKSRHALTAPNGKHFCFNWAKSAACSFGNNCTNFHGCSICGDPGHGAGTCNQRA